MISRSGETKTRPLRLLLQGCVGTLIGFMIAVALARSFFPADGQPLSPPDGLLPWTLEFIRSEPREKAFYLLSLVLGPGGAFLASYRTFRGDIRYSAIALLLVAAIPLGNAYAQFSLQGTLPPWIGFVGALLLAVFYFGLLAKYGIDEPAESLPAPPQSRPRPGAAVVIFGILALAIVPSSFQAVAARIGMETHVVAFLIGPSLYFLGPGLLPGIDYFAQYGIGLGWLFSYLVAKTAEGTMINYVILIVVVLGLFFAHLVWILNWLYRSWLAAAVVGLLVLVLLFHTGRHFSDPSSFVLRYPLLTVCAALLTRWVAAPHDWTRLLLLALAISAALFLETETGVVIAVSVTLSFLLLSPWRLSSLVLMAAVGASSFVFFAALLLLIFGPRALTVPFVSGLIEPLTIYGIAGFGGYPIVWTLREWNWLYNLVAPGIVLATIGVMPRIARIEQIDRPRAALVVFFGACGLLMSAKFINQSIVAVWQMNALGFLVVLGWWAVSVARVIPHRLELRKEAIPARALATTLMVVFAIALAATSSDRRNPHFYGLDSWVRYPSILIRPLHRPGGCIDMSCVDNRPDPRDVALILERTKPGEQVAIVGDLFDWTYLINAHRPPLMAFLPSGAIFTKRQLDESWKRMGAAEYWFVAKGPDGKPKIHSADLAALVMPALEQNFVLDGVGDRLMAWKRKGR